MWERMFRPNKVPANPMTRRFAPTVAIACSELFLAYISLIYVSDQLCTAARHHIKPQEAQLTLDRCREDGTQQAAAAYHAA